MNSSNPKSPKLPLLISSNALSLKFFENIKMMQLVTIELMINLMFSKKK